MSTPSSCSLPATLCLLYLETSYILSTLVLSRDKELSCQRDGPHDMLLQDIVFAYNHDLQNYRQRFVHAWGMVKKTDTKTLGHQNPTPWEPYLKWMRARLQNLMMPFAPVLPVIMN